MTNIKVIKCKLVKSENPYKIIGLSVENQNGTKQIYHESILTTEQINGKTDAECIDIAFLQMSGSISNSINKIEQEEQSVVGSYYVP
jgi:hypothetical protein